MPLSDPDMIHSESTARAFERMFWGLLFFIDFRIGFNNVHVDVLPDFVGWILFATALGWLPGLHTEIKSIRTLTLVLIFLSIFDLVEIRTPVRRGVSISLAFAPLALLGLVALVLGIIVIWRLCGVIIDMAVAVGNLQIRERADFRRKLYTGLMAAFAVATGMCMILPPLILPTVIIGLPLAIIVLGLLMGLMKGTANMCRGAGTPQ